MLLRTEAIVVAVRQHGEHGAIVRALTPADGVQPGYVRGGRSRRLRPVLQPANRILGEWRARTDQQLAQLSVELVESRAPLFAEPLAAAALDWVTALVAATLPEGAPYPRLFAALAGVIDAVAAAPSARGWAVALARFELLLLAELGFGLALDACVATGATTDLACVSPKSGAAVGAEAGAPYADRLLRLPPFLIGGAPPEGSDLLDALALTGFFLDRDLLVERRADVGAARARLIERLKRAVA